LKTKNLLSVADLSIKEANNLIEKALEMKHKAHPQVLSKKVLALLFEKPSLRTRVSFEVAIQQLGGYCLYLSPAEVGLGKREPAADVARVLSRYVDGIISRTFSHDTLLTFTRYSNVPVINALSDFEHPCQALADILTIREKKGIVKGLEIAYLGDGNNVAHSLLLATVMMGANFKIASPKSYEIDSKIRDKATELAKDTGSKIMETSDPREAVKNADVVYTDVWTSMGQETEAEQRRHIFADYQVNSELLSLAKKDVIFMHPLPAHQGEEIAPDLLDLPASVVFDQAENRLHVQRALLAELYAGQAIPNNK
jgi:ornithine carbamoyltransferase